MPELYAPGMHESRWERLFEGLEHQFAAEREREHEALAGESERDRIARLSLRDRFASLGAGAQIAVRDAAGESHRLRLLAVGSDWLAGESEELRGVTIIRICAIDELRLPAAMRRASLAGARTDPLLARMGTGFVLRALARRRAAVTIATLRGGRHPGTISRAGSDHVDVIVHEAGLSAAAASDEVVIALDAIAWVRTNDRGAIDVG